MNTQTFEDIKKAITELDAMQGVLKEVVSVLLQGTDRSSPGPMMVDAPRGYRRH